LDVVSTVLEVWYCCYAVYQMGIGSYFICDPDTQHVDVLLKFVGCVLLRGKKSCELKNPEELLCGNLMSFEIGEKLLPGVRSVKNYF